jgi:4-carboxymuconolactone decarboxylase
MLSCSIVCVSVLAVFISAVSASEQARTDGQGIIVTPSGSRSSTTGATEYFTGSVRIDPLFEPRGAARTSGASVTFEPRARSAWHSHPLGQTLIVTAGVGRVQAWGEPVHEIRQGDVIWTPPGQKHWHGASPTTAMTHMAIQEALDGRAVEWMEHVTDGQYSATPAESAGAHTSASPALERYTNEVLAAVWKRPGLAPRDRSIVTVAALIARNDASEMRRHVALALDNGVQPRELSEIITHLAFYAGWGNATSADAIAAEVFAARRVGADQRAPASPPLLPLNEVAEGQRAAIVASDFGDVAPGVVKYTADLLFRELWRRPALAPRDRSLVTVSALIASGNVEQIPFHLNRALDSGLSTIEVSETLTQLAFYAGWPRVFSALPVVKSVLGQRSR